MGFSKKAKQKKEETPILEFAAFGLCCIIELTSKNDSREVVFIRCKLTRFLCFLYAGWYDLQ